MNAPCKIKDTDWANKLAATGVMKHRPNLDHHGENIFMWSGFGQYVDLSNYTKLTPPNEFVQQMYHDEMRNYNFRTGKAVSLFPSVDSCQLGIGMAFSPDCRQRFVVYNFYPKGNVRIHGQPERFTDMVQRIGTRVHGQQYCGSPDVYSRCADYVSRGKTCDVCGPKNIAACKKTCHFAEVKCKDDTGGIRLQVS